MDTEASPVGMRGQRFPAWALVLAATVPVATEAQQRGVPPISSSDTVPAELQRPLFAPLMADEREVRTFFKLASGGSPFEDTRVFSVGVGDSWRLARVGSGPEGGVVQLAVAGAVTGRRLVRGSTREQLDALIDLLERDVAEGEDS